MRGNNEKGNALSYLENKHILSEFQQALPLHFPKLLGQGTAVHAEVVRQLLAVEGDGYPAAALEGRLLGQVGKQPPPDGLGGGVEDALGEMQVLPGAAITRLRIT